MCVTPPVGLYAEAFKALDVQGRGTADDATFREMCRRTRPDMTESEVERKLLELDPW